MPEEETLEQQSMNQKKMAFANSAHVEAVIQLLRECGGVEKLVGDTEFETLVNAITLDAQGEIMTKFISALDAIRKGSLHEPT